MEIQEITKTSTVVAPRPLTNREMAAILFNIATVLREEGNVNPFRTAAYERGARALMGYPEQAAQVLQSYAQLPFRRRQHIGKKLQAKIREMAVRGALEQYQEMLQSQTPHRAELMTLPGIGPKIADRLHEALGIQTAADLVRAARDGRLRSLPGFGDKRIRQFAALDIPGADPFDLFHLPQAA